jgi:hypothetical protein
VVDKLKRYNFSFGKQNIQEAKQFGIWFEFKRGSNLLGKIP